MKVFQLIIIDLQKDMFCSGGKKNLKLKAILCTSQIVQEHIRKSKRIEACSVAKIIELY